MWLSLRQQACLSILVTLEIFFGSSAAAPYSDHEQVEKRNGGGNARMPYGTSMWNSSQIPQILGTKTDLTSDTRSVETIRNKIALYTFIVDGKSWDNLGYVFADTAGANYSAPFFVLAGLDQITSTLNSSQVKVSRSQHSIGSQFIMLADSRNAYSVSNYQSTQWGQGDYVNEFVRSYGQYQDTWYRQNPKSQDWHIIWRNLVYSV